MTKATLQLNLMTIPGEGGNEVSIRRGAAYYPLKECCKMIASQAEDNRRLMIETLGLYLLIECEKFAKK
jgi:hypothetical protein